VVGEVKTSNGVSGWVLAVRYNQDNRWYRWYGNFYDVLQNHCSLDGRSRLSHPRYLTVSGETSR
jgi:hypothetical protein